MRPKRKERDGKEREEERKREDERKEGRQVRRRKKKKGRMKTNSGLTLDPPETLSLGWGLFSQPSGSRNT